MDGIREYDPNISDEDLIRDAYTLFKEDWDFESICRHEMQDDIDFEYGDGWPAGARDHRENIENRPALNIDRLGQFLNHIKNGMRQNKASIKLQPKGANSAEVAAKRLKATKNRQGLIRFIQNGSDATDAYQSAFDDAVGPGRGWIKVDREYVSGRSHDQNIVISAIEDCMDVVPGRDHTKKDYSDMSHCTLMTTMTKEAFKAKYPNASPDHYIEQANSLWMGSEDLTIAEFYCTWVKKRTLFSVPSEAGDVFGYMDEINDKKMSDEAQAELRETIKEYGKTREVREPFVMWYKMTSIEVLDREEVLGKWVPMVPMLGKEKKVNGKLHIHGKTRKLKDICMMYNYAASQEAERLSLSPKVPYMIAEGQTEGHEQGWKNLNFSSDPYVIYKPTSINGQPVPPPMRQQPIGIDPGLTNAKIGYVEDMKAVSGIDNPSMGMMGPERSGIALQELKRGSDIANLHYTDNARICITHIGRIVNDWIPATYDGSRIITILGDEEEEQELELYGKDDDGDEINLGDGEYDFVVTMGANSQTKRIESMEFMMELIRAVPQVTPLIYDLMVANMDAPGAQAIAERLKKTIPPNLLEQKGGEKQMQMQLQEAMGKLKESEQMMQMLQQALEKAMKELDDNGKEIAKDLEIANINAQSKVAVAEIKAVADSDKLAQSAAQYWDTQFNPQQPGVRQ